MNWLILNNLFIVFLISLGNLVEIFFRKKNLIYNKKNTFYKIIFGLLFLGFYSLVYNFFNKINSISFNIVLLFIFLFSLIYIDKKIIKKIFLFLIFSTIFFFFHIKYDSWL